MKAAWQIFLLVLFSLTLSAEEPVYEGVDQILLLSNRWAIIAVTNMEEVLSEIDELSQGDFYSAVAKWENSVKNGRRNWVEWHKWRTLYNKNIGLAREAAGERLLDSPAHYRILSATDVNYNPSKHPLRITRTIVSLDKEKISGEKDIHWAHYCYLEFPEPLQTGQQYTVLLDSGKSVAFTFDENKTISRAIKVNQMGYLPSAHEKYAYLGCYLQEFGPMDCSHAKEFLVVSTETDAVVLQGQITLRSQNPRLKTDKAEKPLLTGEDTYEIDLSGLKEEGEFYLCIPGIGRSWPFRHSEDAYGEAFYTAARGLYHQRCGIGIGVPYSHWPRIKCHTDPVYESEEIAFLPNIPAPKDFNRFDVIGATTDKTRQTEGPVGGWHDAADWDRTLYHYQCVFDLLHAYEMVPGKFSNGQLNIPGSEHEMPDILSEAEYGLRVWKNSLSAQFGASGTVETFTHPSIDDPNTPYAYSRRTRWASYVFAAAAAQFSQLAAPFDKELSATYFDLAIKAFQYAENPQHSLGEVTIHAAKDRGKGAPYIMEWSEKDAYSIPYKIHACLRLFLATGDPFFLKEASSLLSKAPLPMKWPFSMKDFSCWIYYALFDEKIAPHIAPAQLQTMKKHYLGLADELIGFSRLAPYRQSWPNHQNYWMSWGATCMTNQARVLFIAHHLSGNQKYRDAAILNVDYMLGANPMGMSWTTGLGHVYPINIQHAVSEFDGIADPVPGITLYGITEGIFYNLRTEVWENKLPDGKIVEFISKANRDLPVFRRWSCHPHLNVAQCEFTIHETLSSTVFCTAMLLSDHWKPSESLKKRAPKPPEELHGYWYLP